MAEPLATSLIVGPAAHGAVRHAMTVAVITRSPVVHLGEPEPVGCLPVATPVHHLHYTDRLFGDTTERAAQRFIELVARLPGAIVVTLHDVPPTDGSALAVRRRESYRRVASSTAAVVVASEHERCRVRAYGISADIAVIPLPIERLPAPTDSFPTSGPTVGVLGFIYPGKGHDDVLAALASLPPEVSMWALGGVSPGHDDLLASLERHAVHADRRLTVTGHLDEPTIIAALQAIDVPVVPARSPSASASLATWIGAGRRPVTALNPYSAEIAAVAPNLVNVYQPVVPGALAATLGWALQRPARTWHDGAIPACFSADSVARQHRRLYRRVAGEE